MTAPPRVSEIGSSSSSARNVTIHNQLLPHALDAARLATTHIESEYKVATLSDMRPTHTALRLRDMDTASRRQS